MVSDQIRFDDGAAYERYMGAWSRLAGATFLAWLAPESGLRWLDVGCGNGTFTELLVERCAPASVQGVDPSEAQLAYARTRPSARGAQLAGMDVNLGVAGLAQHLLVYDCAAVTPYKTLDGELVDASSALGDGLAADLGGYVLVARRAKWRFPLKSAGVRQCLRSRYKPPPRHRPRPSRA